MISRLQAEFQIGSGISEWTNYCEFSTSVFKASRIFSFVGLKSFKGMMFSATGWNKINRLNFDFDERNLILRNRVTRTWMRWNSYRKMLAYSSHSMPENDVKWYDWLKHLTSFSAVKDLNHPIFFDKTSIALEFLSPIFQNWIPFIQIEVMSIYFISIGSTIHVASTSDPPIQSH